MTWDHGVVELEGSAGHSYSTDGAPRLGPDTPPCQPAAWPLQHPLKPVAYQNHLPGPSFPSPPLLPPPLLLTHTALLLAVPQRCCPDAIGHQGEEGLLDLRARRQLMGESVSHCPSVVPYPHQDSSKGLLLGSLCKLACLPHVMAHTGHSLCWVHKADGEALR